MKRFSLETTVGQPAEAGECADCALLWFDTGGVSRLARYNVTAETLADGGDNFTELRNGTDRAALADYVLDIVAGTRSPEPEAARPG